MGSVCKNQLQEGYNLTAVVHNVCRREGREEVNITGAVGEGGLRRAGHGWRKWWKGRNNDLH